MLSIPPPPDARVVGSIVRGEAGEIPGHMEVVLDVPGPERQVISFYEDELRRRGWTTSGDSLPRGGGFIPAGLGGGRMFSRPGDGLSIFVSVVPTQGGWNDVRLRTQWSPAEGRFSRRSSPERLIPGLHLPPGIRFQGGGGGGSDTYWTSEGTAETDQTPAALEAHFSSQLQDAGWTRVVGGADGPFAWSSWLLPKKEPWHGYLLVHEAPGKDRRRLLIRAEYAGSRAGHGWRVGQIRP